MSWYRSYLQESTLYASSPPFSYSLLSSSPERDGPAGPASPRAAAGPAVGARAKPQQQAPAGAAVAAAGAGGRAGPQPAALHGGGGGADAAAALVAALPLQHNPLAKSTAHLPTPAAIRSAASAAAACALEQHHQPACDSASAAGGAGGSAGRRCTVARPPADDSPAAGGSQAPQQPAAAVAALPRVPSEAGLRRAGSSGSLDSCSSSCTDPLLLFSEVWAGPGLPALRKRALARGRCSSGGSSRPDRQPQQQAQQLKQQQAQQLKQQQAQQLKQRKQQQQQQQAPPAQQQQGESKQQGLKQQAPQQQAQQQAQPQAPLQQPVQAQAPQPVQQQQESGCALVGAALPSCAAGAHGSSGNAGRLSTPSGSHTSSAASNSSGSLALALPLPLPSCRTPPGSAPFMELQPQPGSLAGASDGSPTAPLLRSASGSSLQMSVVVAGSRPGSSAGGGGGTRDIVAAAPPLVLRRASSSSSSRLGGLVLRPAPARQLRWWVVGGLALAALSGGAVAAAYAVLSYAMKTAMVYSLAWKAATGVAAAEGLALGGWSCSNARSAQAANARSAAELVALRAQAERELATLRGLLQQKEAAHCSEVANLSALNERLTKLSQSLRRETAQLHAALDMAAAERKSLEAAAALEGSRAETSAVVGVATAASERVVDEVQGLARGQQQLVALVCELREDLLGLVSPEQQQQQQQQQEGGAVGAAPLSCAARAASAPGELAVVPAGARALAAAPAGDDASSSSVSSLSSELSSECCAAALAEGGASGEAPGLARLSSVRGGVNAALAATVSDTLQLL